MTTRTTTTDRIRKSASHLLACVGVLALLTAVVTSMLATSSTATAQEHKEKIRAIQNNQDGVKNKDAGKQEGDGEGKSEDAKADDEKVKFATINKPAPDFALKDLDGKEHKLSEYKGKYVILEWYNPQCPYMKKQHEDGPLATMGNEYGKEKDIVWLAINSAAPGEQGSGAERNIDYRKTYGIEYPILLDEPGEVGRLYKAKTTPHMFVIDLKGVLRYQGAIDNAPFGRVAKSGEEFINYVEQAVNELKAGKEVTTQTTRPYGCNVKYRTGGEGQGRGFGQGDGRRGGGKGN